MPPREKPAGDAREGATGDRSRTEKRIEQAAFELLTESGVLAGLNMQAVADRAGVNRALVYLYFKNRQGLLRSALWRRVADTPIWNEPSRSDEPFSTRLVNDLHQFARAGDQIWLHALLHLDGTPDLPVLPFLARSVKLLERDRERGELDPRVNLAAVHVALASMAAGYALFRTRMADELNEPTEDLDRWVEEVLTAMLRGLAPSNDSG